MARLVVIKGADPGRSFELDAPESIIGRQSGVHIHLEGQKVSRRQARVFRQGENFLLEDLGSSNGTFLNGKKLEAPATLQGMDEIGIGPYLLRFESADAPAEFTIRARTAANAQNAELYAGDAAHKLKVILRLSSDLGRSLEVDQLLMRVLDHLFVLFPQAERGLIIFLNQGHPFIRAQKQRGTEVEKARFSSSIVHRVVSEGVGILAVDVTSDSRFAEAQSILTLGVRSLICVPLQTKGGKAMGVLQLDRTGRGHEFSPEDLNLLTAIGLQVSVALENAQLHQELIARQRIENEVALAREIQLSYLPTEAPHLPQKNFELYAELLPANEISGDFYDYFRIGGDRLAIAVADVCGKGIPAALFMSTVRALLRNLAEDETDPGILLQDLNNAVAQQNPKCQFVTISFCVFDPGGQTIEVASAGHPVPLIRRDDGTVEPMAVSQGPLLGFMIREVCYPKLVYQLRAGDLLLLYTDGVTEAPASQGGMFGPERLCAALADASASCRLSQWTESLRKAIEAFTGSRSQEDDITLALLRIH